MRVVALISLTVVLASSAWARDGSKTVLDYRLPKASSTTARSLVTPTLCRLLLLQAKWP